MKLSKALLAAIITVSMLSVASARAQAPASTHVTSINSLSDFTKLSLPGDGFVKGGRLLKFLIDKRQGLPKVYFLNSKSTNAAVKFHYTFTTQVLGVPISQTEFDKTTYFTDNLPQRNFIAGSLQSYEITNNGQTEQFVGIQFYPQDHIREEMILFVAELMKQKVKVAGLPLAFVSQGNQQTVSTVRDKMLTTLGIRSTSIDQVLASVKFIAMNKGAAYGFIRFFPKNVEELTPKDIPIFEELPLDLSVVAGAATFAFQNPGSHINLKSKERKTPNAVIRDQKILDQLKALDGKPMKFDVVDNTVVLTASSEAEVTQEYKKKLPKTWSKVAPPVVKDILYYDEMCPDLPGKCVKLVSSFGGKAAKIGFLNHKDVLGPAWAQSQKIDYPLTSDGFGSPVADYFTFVDANPELKALIQELVKREMGEDAISPAQRAEMAAKIREAFYNATIPAAQWDRWVVALAKLKERIKTANPQLDVNGKKIKIKVRSSGTAEDIPGFNGAGLHDSFSAKINLPNDPLAPCALKSEADPNGVVTKQDMEPENVVCAIKGVYASMWNKRAIEERSFRRVDHNSAGMGLSVVPSYSINKDFGLDETSNSVIITRVLSNGVYGYTVTSNASSDLGDNLVTNPIPGTQPEVGIMTFVSDTETPEVTYTQFAKVLPDQPVRTEAIHSLDLMRQITDITRHIEYMYCRSVRGYYTKPSINNPNCHFATVDNEKKKSLDLEVKVLGDGKRVLFKQVREFAGQ